MKDLLNLLEVSDETLIHDQRDLHEANGGSAGSTAAIHDHGDSRCHCHSNNYTPCSSPATARFNTGHAPPATRGAATPAPDGHRASLLGTRAPKFASHESRTPVRRIYVCKLNLLLLKVSTSTCAISCESRSAVYPRELHFVRRPRAAE